MAALIISIIVVLIMAMMTIIFFAVIINRRYLYSVICTLMHLLLNVFVLYVYNWQAICTTKCERYSNICIPTAHI